MLGTVFRNIICRYMSLYMIDGDKRFFVCIGKSLCEIYADKQRPDKSGIRRYGYRVKFFYGQSRFAQCVRCYFGY